MLKVEINTIDDLAKVIRETRKRQGMSQIDLAGISGLGRRFIRETFFNGWKIMFCV